MDDVTTVQFHGLSEPEALGQVITFAQRFGPLHADLAAHAAFPLVLTPDLLYRIWASFLPQTPWTTVSDILLSSLCREVGYELYEMDPAIRNILLGELREDSRFGETRLKELAVFLEEYIKLNLQSEEPDQRHLAEAQRLTALAHTAPDEAAREIASKLSDPSRLKGAELLRIATLTESLSEQLREYSSLVQYARGVERLAHGDRQTASNLFARVFEEKQDVQVAGVTLQRPSRQPENRQGQEELLSKPDILQSKQLKVFLAHASGDKPAVRGLYHRLVAEGVDAWLDQEKLLPGQDWRLEIPKAVQEADVVVICLSNRSTTEDGYVQKEIKFVLDSAEEKSEGTIFVIPARLEDCAVPEQLSRWQWVDLFEENGFERLLRSLKLRADRVGATVGVGRENQETERSLDQLYTEGLAAFYVEDWDRAYERFQAILREQPDHKKAAEKLAQVERQRNLAKLSTQATDAQVGEEAAPPVTEDARAPGAPSIFISYRRADSSRIVGRLRDRLVAAFGERSVLRDLETIPVGVDFRTVLEREIGRPSVILVVIGPQWANITDAQGNKRLFDPNDFTRIEVESGLRNENTSVIPVLVMNATMPGPSDIPESLRDLLFRNAISIRNDPDFESDMERLIQGIQRLPGAIEPTIASLEPETILISEGSFLMGSPRGEGIPAYETPQHEVNLPAYRIGKYPVTNAQYEEFIRESRRPVRPAMGWDGQKVPAGMENHPVTGITWYEALDYCRWLSEKTGRQYMLPNEAQWEKACRGVTSRIYPWGNTFERDRCNQGGSQVASVDAYPAQGPYGGFDFVGNVSQWTCTLWGENQTRPEPKYGYPWRDDGRDDLNVNERIRRVVRGSSYREGPERARCSARSGRMPSDGGRRGDGCGFRVVMIDTAPQAVTVDKRVFISYAWGGEREEIVNQIDNALQQRGIQIIRDKRNLGYKGSISEFMERTGRGNCVIVVISDKYLRSPNSMYEWVEIAGNRASYDRIFPIVLADANIYDPVRRIEYIKHWEDKLKELDAAMKTVSTANLQGIREEIDSYDRIRDGISGLTSTLKDMNTLTPDMYRDSDFSELYAAVEKRLSVAEATVPQEQASAATRSQVKSSQSAIDTRQESVAEESISWEPPPGIMETNLEGADELRQRLKSEFQVDLLQDWGYSEGVWKPGTWSLADVERLYRTLTLLSDLMGGREAVIRNLGGVSVQKSDIGTHGGEALTRRISFSTKGTFSAWTIIHEFAHAWDANSGWRLSRELERVTGGSTNRLRSVTARVLGNWDAGPNGPENKPGRYGRLPGCNKAGYFYGDKPSGSNWHFNRVEDFAEAVSMYVGWERENELSEHALARIVRYTLKNGERDRFGVVDNWADYAKYFYPENGDYTKTKRWQFIDDLFRRNNESPDIPAA